MNRILASLCCAGLWLIAVAAGAAAQTAASSAPPRSAVVPLPLVNQYCVSCHNGRTRTAGLALDAPEIVDIAAHSDVWEKVDRKLRTGMMPPPGAPKPSPEARRALVSQLETALDRAAAEHPNPGRPLIHRLNRAEYANAIRDLLAIDVDAASLLPPDDASAGFDNVADVLGVSPVLLESYLSAGERIAALAIGDMKISPGGELYRVRQDASQNRHVEGLPFGTVGGILLRPALPLDGEYEIRVKLFRTNLGTMRGLEYPHQLEITVDGERVHLASFGGPQEVSASSENPTTTGDEVDNRLTARFRMKAGPRKISIAFLEKTAARNTRRLQSYVRSSADTIDFSGFPHIDQVLLTGPFNPTGPGDTPSRRKIFVCRPATRSQSLPCADRILSTFARRAYRGDFTAEDRQVLLDFYRRGRAATGRFEGGVDLALRRILSSPKFIFRIEPDPAGMPPGAIYALDDRAIASRLSFFLWSSIPDDELLGLAAQGRLKQPDVLAAQVRRMLEHPKSHALFENFVSQWLQLRNLKTKIPNSNEFPDFDDNVRLAMATEIDLFFASIVHEDRSVLDLLTADDTFVNEDLARHYGIPGIYGSHFRRVRVDDTRRGLLAKGALLMVTSHAHRTSPVLRGRWILENIVGAPVPPPPDDVPAFMEDVDAQKPRSVRERMEQHRRNPACAGCHRVIDPVGFALENFDAVGAWRARDGGTRGTPIDASGQLADGTTVNGIVDLRHALAGDPEIFVRTFTEKLLVYAIGRGLGPADMPVVRGIVRAAASDQYRFSTIVLGVVNSAPFRLRLTRLAED